MLVEKSDPISGFFLDDIRKIIVHVALRKLINVTDVCKLDVAKGSGLPLPLTTFGLTRKERINPLCLLISPFLRLLCMHPP